MFHFLRIEQNRSHKLHFWAKWIISYDLFLTSFQKKHVSFGISRETNILADLIFVEIFQNLLQFQATLNRFLMSNIYSNSLKFKLSLNLRFVTSFIGYFSVATTTNTHANCESDYVLIEKYEYCFYGECFCMDANENCQQKCPSKIDGSVHFLVLTHEILTFYFDDLEQFW